MAETDEKVPEETPAPEGDKAPEPEQKPETVSEILKDEKPDEKPAENLVPEAALLAEKKGRKEWERKFKELEKQIQSGANREDISEDIDAILTEYGLDDTNKQFFAKLVKAVEAKAESRAEAKTSEKLKPIEERERAQRLDAVFKKHYDEALEAMPEFKEIANPAVIKTLSLAPENKDKTFAQIIESVYGSAVTGKRTIETTTSPGGGKTAEPIDFDKAKKDPTYLREILKDPARKAEYNKNLVDRLNF